MNAIRRAGVIAFIDWISREHSSVPSIKSLSKERFMSLAVEYEASKGLRIDKGHDVYRKWESTQWIFSINSNDSDALGQLS